MTLELRKVVGQIEEMGRLLAERASQERKVLPAALDLLQQLADRQDYLRQVAESEAGQRLRCASPGHESLAGSWPAAAAPARATLIAADGSQIYPDRHGLAFYYVINVGAIVFHQGSGRAPDIFTEPQLCYREERVFPQGNPVSDDLVSAERDLAEMRVLTELALGEPHSGPPRLALADGSLLIWLQRAAVPEDQQARILADYLHCLDRLRSGDVGLAGFVSRPRSAEVIALLYLASLEAEQREAVDSLAKTGFRHLTDRMLFDGLRVGHRSALFVRGTAPNRDFQSRGHAVHFFYLNTGGEVARVEVPEWVACQSERLQLVHTLVYEQCRFNQGYPYVLARADEQAIILGEERELVEEMISRAMIQHGLPPPEPSLKARQKRVARWRRG